MSLSVLSNPHLSNGRSCQNCNAAGTESHASPLCARRYDVPFALNHPATLSTLTYLTGANEILASLRNDEGKVAYLIRTTAIVLQKASMAIDPSV